jgi:hypothetical protein
VSSPLFFPVFRAFDHSTGAPLAGGKLFTYVAGTSIPQATFTDASLVTPNSNPVILDANGEAKIFVGTLTYKFILQDALGVVQWTIDNVNYGSSFSSIGGHSNLGVSGSFEIWQAGTTFTPAAATGFHADGWAWRIIGTPADYTLSRQLAGNTGKSLYGLRVQRNPGAGSNNGVNIVQNIESVDSGSFNGQFITLSFWARTGANFSGTLNNLNVQVLTGTGTDESWQTAGTLTGSLGVLFLTATPISGQDWTYYFSTSSSPIISGCNEMSIILAAGAWSGTAGANDWIEFDDVKLEIGAQATPYDRQLFNEDLRQAQRRYYKSFPYSVTPAQNAGIAGAYTFPQVVAAATAMTTPSLPIPEWMRDVAGTITTFNPLIANAQARNITVAADCSATVGVTTSNEAHATLTSAAGSAAGNVNAVHVVMDKRF